MTLKHHRSAIAICFALGMTAGGLVGFRQAPAPVTVAAEPEPVMAPILARDNDVDTISTAHRRTLFRQVGTASWYGKAFEGKPMANTLPFKRRQMTAAHRTLPLGSKLRIVNLDNGHVIEVTVTDRGPYIPGRVIDLSERAASLLGMRDDGLATVAIEAINIPGVPG